MNECRCLCGICQMIQGLFEGEVYVYGTFTTGIASEKRFVYAAVQVAQLFFFIDVARKKIGTFYEVNIQVSLVQGLPVLLIKEPLRPVGGKNN